MRTVTVDKIASITQARGLGHELRIDETIPCEEGVIIVVEVLNNKSTYNTLELTSGRMAGVKRGDIIVGALGHRKALFGYSGHVPERLAVGDTLQAVKAHRFADPFDDPGEVDLTTHVDFTALADAARSAGAAVRPVTTQGDWLQRLGIDARLQSLATSAPDRVEELKGQRDRLVAADAMGELFKVMAITAPGWPTPAGFTGDSA